MYNQHVAQNLGEEDLWAAQRKFTQILLEQHQALYDACEKAILKAIDYQVRIAQLKGYNVPKAVKFYFNCDWTWNRVLFTPSQKKQHRGFRTEFAKEISELWGQPAFAEKDAGGFSSKTDGAVEKKSMSTFMVIGLVFALIGIIGKLFKK